jgi:two-component system, cell cycle sensor histidine kinase and response regulator CckA
MKSTQSDPHRNHPVYSPEGSAFPFVARISEPAKTLLVVDDDPMVRNLETQVLRLYGYEVLEAESAAKALQLAGVTAPIHLLITDLMMPEIDGMELTRRFRAVHPETPVLMVSGSLPLVQHRADDLDRFDFLAKPFQFTELLHKVRTLLDATAPLPIRNQWCCD